jgi:putative ABC transport system substrate-binding protein
MKRRTFIGLVGGSAIWPLIAQAQQSRLPRIGVLVPANPEPFWSVFREALRERGYVEGRTIQFEFRSADGRPNLLPALAAEFVRLKVDIIVASQTPAVTAAKQATTEIPIVMAAAGDPVGTGLVASLAQPGGNVTGMSGTTTELGGKILELIRDMLPAARRVAVLANPTDPFTKPFLGQIEASGRVLGLAVQTTMIRGVEEFEAAFAAMTSERVDAVIVQPSLPRKPAAELALKYRVPPISPTRLFPSEGGLMSYSANQIELTSRAVDYVDRILKGARPADLPVEQPTKFELVINLKAANALGLTIPPILLARADEVIE